ncbi:MAG: hypothetical protein LBI35_04435 [Burkholderiales bacterium]|jgi:hypothetical protein|nr:hypothetical protein [Burkholderiales bacterium]
MIEILFDRLKDLCRLFWCPVKRIMSRLRCFIAHLRNGSSLRVAWIFSRNSDDWKWRGVK